GRRSSRQGEGNREPRDQGHDAARPARQPRRGEKVIAESGELSWLTDSIQLTTSTKMAGSKGLVGGLKRAFAGGSLFMTEYRAEGGPGTVAFATKVPGEIHQVEVNGDSYRIHHH